jgi:death-on-curing protein
MVAAYAFHICQNHPFIDRNERVALTSSLVFLDINGYIFNCKEEMAYGKIMDVAKGKLNEPPRRKCANLRRGIKPDFANKDDLMNLRRASPAVS